MYDPFAKKKTSTNAEWLLSSDQRGIMMMMQCNQATLGYRFLNFRIFCGRRTDTNGKAIEIPDPLGS